MHDHKWDGRDQVGREMSQEWLDFPDQQPAENQLFVGRIGEHHDQDTGSPWKDTGLT